MNDKRRAEFEKWAKSDGFQLDVDKYGSYKSLCTWAAWKSWQASIASVVVKLPNHFNVDGVGIVMDAAAACNAVLDAGVKYE